MEYLWFDFTKRYKSTFGSFLIYQTAVSSIEVLVGDCIQVYDGNGFYALCHLLMILITHLLKSLFYRMEK